MSRTEIKKELCDFLDTIAVGDGSLFDTDENVAFHETGLVDSLSMLEIVSFLERRFSIDFSRTGIDAERLGSIGRILDLIESSES